MYIPPVIPTGNANQIRICMDYLVIDNQLAWIVNQFKSVPDTRQTYAGSSWPISNGERSVYSALAHNFVNHLESHPLCVCTSPTTLNSLTSSLRLSTKHAISSYK